ncbi:MAG TPA: hypothetical protein VFJ53_03580 [Solirubrobacterales bacterium]|nr:hypothetical protein [Solirubrobacterales bacterium]
MPPEGGATEPRWWAMRPAQNLKPATYRCPLCGEHLPALSEHVLIWPEGDKSRRRHAHTECVLRARKAGRLPTEDEWRADRRGERSSPRIPGTGAFARLRARLFGKD